MNHNSAVLCRPERARVDPRTLGAVLLHSEAIALAAIRRRRIVFANPAFVATFRADDSLTGVRLADIVFDAEGGEPLAASLAAAEHAPTRYWGTGRRGDGSAFEVELSLECIELGGEPTVVALAWDGTGQHRASVHLADLAYTDPLTGLANRAMFADRLHQAVRRARRHAAAFAVLMMDLDGFKAINDTYGHQAGDVALQLTAQQFQRCVRGEGDTLARIGGDEFAVLLPRLTDQQAPALVAQRIIDSLAGPLDLGAHSVQLGTSVGIAVWPEHAGNSDALLAAADTAMYRAKRAGGNQFLWATGRSHANIVSLQPLAWSAAHAIGIKEIDDQHMHMAELIDQLSAALNDDCDSHTILANLSELTQFAAFHFATEERLMEQHQVEGLVPHREEHRRLLHDIGNLKVDEDVASISLILRYLQEWLLRHVDGMDRQLGKALMAKGWQ
jgi:diguanylate cyclase (GGDEF)-like protein/hemerythrin-like metal-binding protein